MPVPAIPPEIIAEILQKLPAGEDATIDTLFACMLVSSVFKATARLDSVWVPIVRCNGNLGHIPRYVALSNEQDKHELELTLKRKELSSTYDCILARSTFEEIVNRHLAALLAEPNHKIPHILAIAELGECNTFPVLDKLAFLQSGATQAEDWLARRYWARQVRGAISRRKAFDVWRRIGAGWDGVEAFCEGVFAFDAFHGSQDMDDVSAPVRSAFRTTPS